MIKCDNISKSYAAAAGQTTVLNNINLHLKPGAKSAIIGASGAGKTSLIRILSGLDAPSSGRLQVGAELIDFNNNKQLKAHKRNIGFVAQTYNLLNGRSVLENIYLALEVQNIKNRQNIAYAEYLLEKVGLNQHKHSYPDQLSGGQKQRVIIARALVTHPQILLCDELTSALDANTTNQILNLLQNLHQELNFSLLIITHDLYVAKTLAQEIYVLDNGEIAESGCVLKVFNAPKSQAAINLINANTNNGDTKCN